MSTGGRRPQSIPLAPITDKDISQASEQEKLFAQSYLKTVIDFAKWISTVAIAAGLWIGSNLSSISGLPLHLSIVALILIVSSLIIAVFAVKRVLAAWATEWKVAIEDYSFLLFKKLKAFKTREMESVDPDQLADIEKIELEHTDRLITAIDSSRRFSEPKGFSAWISWQIALLVAGLFLYVLTQILNSL